MERVGARRARRDGLRGRGRWCGQFGSPHEHRRILVNGFRHADPRADDEEGDATQLNLVTGLQDGAGDLLVVDAQAIGRRQVLHFEDVALEVELGVPARQLRVAEAEFALDRAPERHRTGDVILVALVFAMQHFEQPAWRRADFCADLGRIDDLQLERAQAQPVARADLVTLADLLIIDIAARRRAQVGQVMEAVLLVQLRMERLDAWRIEHQVVAAVAAERDLFVGKPDRGLAIVHEVNS